jgi:probable rRNA maturation factor
MITIRQGKYAIDDSFRRHVRALYRGLKLQGRVVMRIVDEAEAASLNCEFRHKAAPTDVLTFPLHEQLPDGLYAGDIMICYPVAQAQARAQGHSLQRELVLLAIHGLLHLAGMDHETDAGEMLKMQRRLFRGIMGAT